MPVALRFRASDSAVGDPDMRPWHWVSKEPKPHNTRGVAVVVPPEVKSRSAVAVDKEKEKTLIADATWQHVVDISLDNVGGVNGTRPLPNSSQRAVDMCQSYDKMSVGLALQVVNDKVIAALEKKGRFGTAVYLSYSLLFWNAATSHSRVDSIDGLPMRQLNEVCDWLNCWSRCLDDALGPGESKSGNRFIPHEIYRDIVGFNESARVLLGEMKKLDERMYLVLSKISQSPLESHFGESRSMNGSTTNPTAEQYAQGKVRKAEKAMRKK